MSGLSRRISKLGSSRIATLQLNWTRALNLKRRDIIETIYDSIVILVQITLGNDLNHTKHDRARTKINLVHRAS